MQRDPLSKSAPGSQGWNRYAYGANNPVNVTDPSGHDPACGSTGIMPPLFVACEVVTDGPKVVAGAAAVVTAVGVGAGYLWENRDEIGAAVDGYLNTIGTAVGAAGAAIEEGVLVLSGRKGSLQRDPDAEGPHATFERDSAGRVVRYNEYDEHGNLVNLVKRFRGEGIPHGGVKPPLILEPEAGKGPGSRPKVPRQPTSDELPPGY